MSTDSITSIVAVLSPQYATDPRLDDLIILAKLNTSIVCFGDTTETKYKYAVALRVCHGLALEARDGGATDGSDSGGGASGALKSEKEGQLSKSYEQTTSEDNGFGDLNATTYGQKLIELIKGNCVLPMNRLV